MSVKFKLIVREDLVVSFGYYPGMFKSRLREIYCMFLGLPFPERRLEHLMMFKMIPFKARDKVLDVGSGEGYFIPTFSMTGCEFGAHTFAPTMSPTEE